MTTKTETVAALKLEYPTLKSGSDETGYTDLNPTDYEATIEKWAEAELERQAKAAEAEAKAAQKAAAEAKLAALGLTSDDLKALGLGGN